eukprot:NODE_11422_length_306_cov_16.996109_g10509_i0.p2 GENE.NODE_11422_length_306_cov_16.996109_g10509_i0~~NODE_11422_length_306_cov_16.996109_g10509_i0.p2  ORF type:complete len:65 (+),score=20.48 NODE_11422_length_306_cov_16.996109_g10509_i0:30-197(+)
MGPAEVRLPDGRIAPLSIRKRSTFTQLAGAGRVHTETLTGVGITLLCDLSKRRAS